MMSPNWWLSLTFAVKFTYHFKWQKPDELIKWINPGHWHVVNVTQLKDNLAPLSNLRWKNQLKKYEQCKTFLINANLEHHTCLFQAHFWKKCENSTLWYLESRTLYLNANLIRILRLGYSIAYVGLNNFFISLFKDFYFLMKSCPQFDVKISSIWNISSPCPLLNLRKGDDIY